MLILQMRRGVLPKDGVRDFDEFLRDLRSTMPSVIQPTRELQAVQLGVGVDSLKWGQPTSRRPTFASLQKGGGISEVFILDTGLLVVKASTRAIGGELRMVARPDGSIEQVASQTQDVLEATAIMSSVQDAISVLDTVSRAAQSSLHIEIKDYFFQSERFGSLRAEVVAETFEDNDSSIAAAKALSSRSARTAAVAIKSSRGLLARDLEKLGSVVDAADVVQKLVAGGVATKDVVVVCGATQSQVARVRDRDSLEKMAEAGLRCACGKPIDQESVDDLLSITDLGALLLDKSRWLSLLVRETLVGLGVPREDILLECQFGTDEIDCIAQISGDLTILELKDKEFSMGNAYSFSAKISAVSPKHSIIVTTDKVASDVKERFSRVGSRARDDFREYLRSDENESVEYVEGDNFESGLRRIVGRIYRKDANRILDDAFANLIPTAASVLDTIGKFD